MVEQQRIRQQVFVPIKPKAVPRLDVEDQGIEMQEMRCPNCGHFLMYQAVIIGALKIKCRHCKLWVTLDIIPNDVIIDDEAVEEAIQPEG
jgi:phage FluMu protein Com